MYELYDIDVIDEQLLVITSGQWGNLMINHV